MVNGKKTQKMHIRLTEDLAREVRALAELESRDIQDQIRVLIFLGLQSRRQGSMADIRLSVTHAAAQAELPMSPTVAPRRTGTRKEGVA